MSMKLKEREMLKTISIAVLAGVLTAGAASAGMLNVLCR